MIGLEASLDNISDFTETAGDEELILYLILIFVLLMASS